MSFFLFHGRLYFYEYRTYQLVLRGGWVISGRVVVGKGRRERETSSSPSLFPSLNGRYTRPKERSGRERECFQHMGPLSQKQICFEVKVSFAGRSGKFATSRLPYMRFFRGSKHVRRFRKWAMSAILYCMMLFGIKRTILWVSPPLSTHPPFSPGNEN